jgi:hypothetical protein
MRWGCRICYDPVRDRLIACGERRRGGCRGATFACICRSMWARAPFGGRSCSASRYPKPEIRGRERTWLRHVARDSQRAFASGYPRRSLGCGARPRASLSGAATRRLETVSWSERVASLWPFASRGTALARRSDCRRTRSSNSFGASAALLTLLPFHFLYASGATDRHTIRTVHSSRAGA